MQFHTPFRTYRFCILPQGYVNGTAAFFRDMNRSMAGLPNVKNYVNNVIIFTPPPKAYIRILYRM